jgi:hypothetical protein
LPIKEDRRGKIKTYPALPTQISREANLFWRISRNARQKKDAQDAADSSTELTVDRLKILSLHTLLADALLIPPRQASA